MIIAPFCSSTTMALIESDDRLSALYERYVLKGHSQEDALLLVYSEINLKENVEFDFSEKYNELLREFQFSLEKMRKFMLQDALIRFVVKDLKTRGHEENEALSVVFNSYVIEDSSMRSVYKEL